jgi:hypothetical protein
MESLLFDLEGMGNQYASGVAADIRIRLEREPSIAVDEAKDASSLKEAYEAALSAVLQSWRSVMELADDGWAQGQAFIIYWTARELAMRLHALLSDRQACTGMRTGHA